jgi:hypothetical protein
MASRSAWFALLVALATVFLLTLGTDPVRPRDWGVSWWGVGNGHDVLPSEVRRRREELQHALAGAHARLEARRQIAREVLAGRLDLLTAAAEFRRLDQQVPRVATVLATWHPEMSPGERACRHVFVWVEDEVCRSSQGPVYCEMLVRLGEQLEQEIRAHGEVQLPDCP